MKKDITTADANWHLWIDFRIIVAPDISIVGITVTSNDASASPLLAQPFIQAQIKENIKAPRHWPWCGKFAGHR